jgi:drug/metabolite transporter (DMT)-like permease
MTYALALVVALLWAIYPFLIKQVKHTHHLVIWALMSSIAAIISILVCLVSGKKLLVSWDDFKLITMSSVLGPVLAFLLYFYLISITPKVTLVTALAFTTPVFAVLLGSMFFNEPLTTKQTCGILIVVLGVLLCVI